MRTTDSVQEITRERWRLLRQVDQLLELPMVVLGFAWLALLVWELTAGLTPFWEAINTAIWVAFVLDFVGEGTNYPVERSFHITEEDCAAQTGIATNAREAMSV